MNASSQNPECRATVSQGVVKGSVVDQICVYRGIPYAQPMLGELRFQPPMPAKPWGAELDATRNSCISPQNRSRLAAAMGDFEFPQDEDCLTLNICAPRDTRGNLPVVVWLHGGAFSSGAGSLPWYSGENMARNGHVVTVSINYRLGALGFLYLPGVAEGNMGLKDQVLAIRWIKDNIGSFGGDPGNITLAGQSAGGASIAALLTMPDLDGLFRRIIMQSASIGRLFFDPEEAEKLGRSFLKHLDLDYGDAHKLRHLPVGQLLKAQQDLGAAEYKLAQTKPPFWLVRDGDFIDNELLDCVARRELNVDMLIGTTREEMMAFYYFDARVRQADDDAVADLFRKEFGERANSRMRAYKSRRAVHDPATLLGDMYTDQVFRLPSLRLAELFGEKRLGSYVYQFDWSSPNGMQACHCLEIPFVFHNFENWDAAPMLEGADQVELNGLATAVQQAWVAFARSGNPNHPGIPVWEAYTGSNRNVMHFDRLIGPQQAWQADLASRRS